MIDQEVRGVPAEETLVTMRIDQGVAVLAWNRPERNNGWTHEMGDAYYDLLRQCESDPHVRVIVVTGTGKSFCPGMDMQALEDSASGKMRTSPHLSTPINTPRSIDKPIIAAINGACAGIGLVSALNADLRFAADTAKLTTSFARRGIMAEHGVAWSLQQLIGPSRAMDLLLSARIVQGQEALAMGLVDRVFAPEELMDRTMDYARDLAQNCSPLAMGVTKRQVYAAQDSTHDEARDLSYRYWYDVIRDHADFAEGVESFMQRRAPRFAPWDPATTRDPAPLP